MSRAVRCLAASGGALLGLTVLVVAGWLRPLDRAIAPFLFYDTPAWVLQLSTVATLVFSAQLSLLWAVGLAIHWARGRRAVLGLAMVGVLGVLLGVEVIAKELIDQPEPSAVLSLDRSDFKEVNVPAPLDLYLALPNSYPSGHATRVGYFVLLLMAVGRPRAASRFRGLVPVTLAALGVAPALLSWHWISDIVGGLLLGATGACFLAVLRDRLHRSQRRMSPSDERPAPSPGSQDGGSGRQTADGPSCNG
jgi:membrane-associated phospholipid phosphatase